VRRRTTLLVGSAVAVALVLGGLVGGVLAESRSVTTSSAAPVALADRALAGAAGGVGASTLAGLEAQVRAQPRDARLLTQLGFAYQLRWRETADPSYLPRSETALRRAVRFGVDDADAVLGLGSLALIKHEFRVALRHGQTARKLLPGSSRPFGVIGDALVELGRYDEAFEAFDRMAARKPTLAAYARVAYARELLGRPAAAIAAMKLAVGAGAGQGENEAWALVELGHLHFNSGRLRPAERAYRGALARFPGYHRAQAGLARIEAARGRLDAAVGLYRRALEAVPLPEYAAALGETLEAAGRMDEAQEAYAVVDATQRLLEANGVRTDLETALIDLDRGVRLPDALARAREAYEERRSIEAEDVLAWALYKNGRCEEARAHSVRALRLGTLSALKLFHRGLIERCLGRGEESEAFLRRALDVNPYFSLRYAPVAQEALR
jgi:tetratricopeptide (TPR) repeat protein